MLIPEGETLVTYYMLPLVGVNKLTFGRSFNTSFIDQYGTKLYVELSKNMHSPVYKTNANYVTEIMHKAIKFIVFAVPEEFETDAQLFTMGAYSQMSHAAKKRIYLTSSLPYNATMGDFKVSHPILQALDKTKRLRGFLEDELGVKSLENSNELIDKPHAEWYIENRFKVT
jgi:hypothetical protein